MTQDPISAPPFALDRLNDDEWEELTFLLAHNDDPRVVRLRAPDGGLDAVLPRTSASRNAERGWQAKHYPGPIRWQHCIASLDRAVELWETRHVTFVFPRDLTRNEHALFAERLTARHKGVTVDYWPGSSISARLLATDAGKRIAQRFFGRDPIETIERAARAGGDLSRAEHAIERQFAVGEFVQQADPHFHWVVYQGLADGPESPRTPGAILRLRFGKGEQRLIVDAVPRSRSSLDHYGPTARIITDDSLDGEEARRLMRALFEGGGRLKLREGVKLGVERLPRPFGELITEPVSGELTVKAVSTAEPWSLCLKAETDVGAAGLDVELLPTDPPAEWDSQWEGSRGGLSVLIRARWSVNDGRGETSVSLRYQGATPAAHADRAQALALHVALHGRGTLRLIDHARVRETVVHPLERRPIDDGVIESYRLLDALVELERASGRRLPPIPAEIKLAEADRLVHAAAILRAGGELYRLRDAKLTGPSKLVSEWRRAGSELTVTEIADVRVFGQPIPVARRVIRLPLMQIKEAVRIGRGDEDLWEITIVPAHANEIEVWADFEALGGAEAQG